MDRAQIETLIEQTFAARKAGDLDKLVGLFRPDATFRIVGAPDVFPFGVTARGEPQIREAVRLFVDTLEFFDDELVDLIVEGDRAARRRRLKIRHRATNEVRDTEVCDLWRFKDGRIASFVQFVDTAMLADLEKGAEGRAFREPGARTERPAGPAH